MALLNERCRTRLHAGTREAARLAVGVAVIVSMAVAPTSGFAQRITQDEALALAFPEAEMRRATAFLSEEDRAEARRLAGDDVDVDMGLVTYYVAEGKRGPVGVAYFDAHRVRTLDEVLLIALDTDGTVRRVETVLFREPPEYEAPEGWLELFEGATRTDDLSLKGEIPTIIGATLTSGAVSAAVRRTLALHTVIDPFGDVLES